MFSKAIVLLVLAATAIAGPIAEGTYKITNFKSQSTARVDYSTGPIYVSSTNTNPGPFEIWTLKDAPDNGYTIDNVGLNVIMMLDTFAAVRQPEDGEPVVTNRNPTVFNIESGGPDGTFVIKLQNDDLLWNVEPPVTPGGPVALRTADGTATQKWTFTPVQWPPA